MKFVSKNANLGVVLKPGIQGNAQLGTSTVSGLYARFKDGMLDVSDESMIQLMLKHPGFGVDYYSVEAGESDPYANTRVQSEPAHIISEMKNGHPERVTKAPVVITPELKALLTETATEMAKPMAIELARQMLPSMVQETLKALHENNTGLATAPVAPRKAGRPKKVETV